MPSDDTLTLALRDACAEAVHDLRPAPDLAARVRATDRRRRRTTTGGGLLLAALAVGGGYAAWPDPAPSAPAVAHTPVDRVAPSGAAQTVVVENVVFRVPADVPITHYCGTDVQDPNDHCLRLLVDSPAPPADAAPGEIDGHEAFFVPVVDGVGHAWIGLAPKDGAARWLEVSWLNLTQDEIGSYVDVGTLPTERPSPRPS